MNLNLEPIFNAVLDAGNKFEYANIGFAILIGERIFTKGFHRIFLALTLVHPFNVWLTARKRAQEEADRLALNPGEDTGFVETNELVCLCGIYGPYHMDHII